MARKLPPDRALGQGQPAPEPSGRAFGGSPGGIEATQIPKLSSAVVPVSLVAAAAPGLFAPR